MGTQPSPSKTQDQRNKTRKTETPWSFSGRIEETDSPLLLGLVPQYAKRYYDTAVRIAMPCPPFTEILYCAVLIAQASVHCSRMI